MSENLNSQPTILPGATGTLFIIGGHEDKSEPMTILRRFVAAAGGANARIVAITTASAIPEVMAATYAAAFKTLGVTNFTALEVASRAQANDPAIIAACNQASGILLSGGEQVRLTVELGGTQLEEAVRQRYIAGAVVAGTSAGASALGETSILDGPASFEVLREGVSLGAGLDLVRNVLIDQHFDQRLRIYRLLSVLALNPGLLAVGIDEDTAIIVTPDGCAEVIGSGAVTIVDGRFITYTNLPNVDKGQPISITGLTLHILTDGHKFDLNTRTPIIPTT
ncbi:MAG: cyanophycinase [Candidatus Chloroheliales bacterium]|nr:MAG: cyanophycinase [Chloroflexota bacterium]